MVAQIFLRKTSYLSLFEAWGLEVWKAGYKKVPWHLEWGCPHALFGIKQRLEKDPGYNGQESVTLGMFLLVLVILNTKIINEPKRKKNPEYDDHPQLTETEHSPITALRSWRVAAWYGQWFAPSGSHMWNLGPWICRLNKPREWRWSQCGLCIAAVLSLHTHPSE